jgi:hypothetical protein
VVYFHVLALIGISSLTCESCCLHSQKRYFSLFSKGCFPAMIQRKRGIVSVSLHSQKLFSFISLALGIIATVGWLYFIVQALRSLLNL